MAFLDYDGQRFKIDAEEVFDFDFKFLGYVPICSSKLLVPPEMAGSELDLSTVGWIPSPFFPEREPALRAAVDFVRLNWDAQKSKRKPVPGDKVGRVTTNLVGQVVQSAAAQLGYVDVKFGSKVEAVPMSELVFVP